MSYTALRVDPDGVVLFEHHLARFRECGPAVRDGFLAFARSAKPGVWTLRAVGPRLVATPRDPSLLFDAMPIRTQVSPFAGARGRLAKPPSPCPYDSVRTPGVATLLSSADGSELYEACSAALVGWDGAALVIPPDDRPRVASTAEAALCLGRTIRAPLRADSSMPVAMVNAIKGLCLPSVPGRERFPPEAVQAVALLLGTGARA